MWIGIKMTVFLKNGPLFKYFRWYLASDTLKSLMWDYKIEVQDINILKHVMPAIL